MNLGVKEILINNETMIFRCVIAFWLFLIIGSCKQEKKKSDLVQKVVNKSDLIKKNNLEKIERNKKQLEGRLIGLINDPDGYTNIRNEPNSESNIVGKIIKGDYFYYDRDVNSNWYSVTTQNGLTGYVHKSRINEVDTKFLFFLKINSEDPSDFSFDRDTIVEIKSLNTNSTYAIRGYNYSEINKLYQNEDSISFDCKNMNVHIIRKKVDLNDYKLKLVKENNSYKVIADSGFEVYGAIGKPKYEISNIKGRINNQVFSVNNDKLKYLFEPNLGSAKVYKKSDHEIIVYLKGSDASEGYEAIFLIEDQNLVKRHIYRNF